MGRSSIQSATAEKTPKIMRVLITYLKMIAAIREFIFKKKLFFAVQSFLSAWSVNQLNYECWGKRIYIDKLVALYPFSDSELSNKLLNSLIALKLMQILAHGKASRHMEVGEDE